MYSLESGIGVQWHTIRWKKHAKHSIHPWEHMSERLEESRSDTPKYNGTQISNLGPMGCTWVILEMTSWSEICTMGSAALRTTQGYWNSPFHTNPLDSHLQITEINAHGNIAWFIIWNSMSKYYVPNLHQNSIILGPKHRYQCWVTYFLYNKCYNGHCYI